MHTEIEELDYDDLTMETMAFWKPNRYPSPDEVKGGELQCQTALQKHFSMVPSSNRM